jgi:tripartite-type tricarboxylate transporter receptor subunit TctC
MGCPGASKAQRIAVHASAGAPARNKEINAGLTDPKMKSRLADLGGSALAGSPANFGKLIAEETQKWAKVVRAANIKAE